MSSREWLFKYYAMPSTLSCNFSLDSSSSSSPLRFMSAKEVALLRVAPIAIGCQERKVPYHEEASCSPTLHNRMKCVFLWCYCINTRGARDRIRA